METFDGEDYFLLYHRTTRDSADRILLQGFQDGHGEQGIAAPTRGARGVFVSDVPLDMNEGASGDVLLMVIVDEAELDEYAEYEVIDEDKTYREWLVPAALLNTHAVIEVDEDDARSGKISLVDWTCAMCELDYPATARRFPIPGEPAGIDPDVDGAFGKYLCPACLEAYAARQP